MSGRVVVVGSVNVDLVIRTARLPGSGETVTGGTFERHHGGKGGNQAVAAARLGRPTLFVGAVGEDAFGSEARSALKAEHVDVSRLATIPEAPTGVALILVDDLGENLISVASGANALVTPEMVREALGRLGPLDGDVVLVCHEIPTPTVREALATARAAGARTVFNPAPAVGLDRATVGLADIITPNRTELAALVAAEAARTGAPRAGAPRTDPERAAISLLGDGAEGPGVRVAVIVTLGSSGALLVTYDGAAGGGSGRESGRGALRTLDLPAHQVTAVDSTGAGDAFNGALAAALAEGRSIDVACRRAIVAGALATTRVGAREGMPTAAELEAAIAG